MKKTIAAGIVALAALFGVTAPVDAGKPKLPTTSVEVFEDKDPAGKGQVIVDAVNAIGTLYSDQKDIECIKKLYPEGVNGPGYAQLSIAVAEAMAQPQQNRPSVERLIFNIIDINVKNNCPIPTDQ